MIAEDPYLSNATPEEIRARLIQERAERTSLLSPRIRQDRPGWPGCDPLCSHNPERPASENPCDLGIKERLGSFRESEEWFLYWKGLNLPVPPFVPDVGVSPHLEIPICSHICDEHRAPCTCPHFPTSIHRQSR
jgi:hypothetical protein